MNMRLTSGESDSKGILGTWEQMLMHMSEEGLELGQCSGVVTQGDANKFYKGQVHALHAGEGQRLSGFNNAPCSDLEEAV